MSFLIILFLLILFILLAFVSKKAIRTGGSAMSSQVYKIKSKKLPKSKAKKPELSVTNIIFDADKDGDDELKAMLAIGSDVITFTYLPQVYIPKIQELAPQYEHLCRYDIDDIICCAVFSKHKFDYSINKYCANAVIDLRDRIFSIYVVYRPEYENLAKVIQYDTFNKLIVGYIPDNESLLETGYKRHSDTMYTLGYKSYRYTSTTPEKIILS